MKISLARAAICSIFIFTSASHLSAQVPVIQESHGWCSPNIANVTGSVTVICNIPPEVLKVLNVQLAREHLLGDDALVRANQWVKKYHQLEDELETFKGSPGTVQKARQLVRQGKFEEAGALIDKLLEKTEATTTSTLKQLALANLVKGELLEIQGKDSSALLYFERAYIYDPANVGFAVLYADHLSDLGLAAKAEIVLRSVSDLSVTSGDQKTQINILTAQERLAMLYMSKEKCTEGIAVVDKMMASPLYPTLISEMPLKDLDPVVLLTMQATCYRVINKADAAAIAIDRAAAYLNKIPANAIEQNRSAGSAFFGFAQFYGDTPGAESKAKEYYTKTLKILREQAKSGRSSDIAILEAAVTTYADFLRTSEGETVARPYFDEAISLSKDLYERNQFANGDRFFEALTAKARSYLQTEEFPAVIELLEKNLAAAKITFVKPSDAMLNRFAQAHAVLGTAYYRMGQLPAAKLHFDHAIQYRVNLINNGANTSLEPLGSLYMREALICDKLGDIECEENCIDQEVDNATKLARVDPEYAKLVPEALNHRSNFMLQRHQYSLAQHDAAESERIATSLSEVGVPVHKILVNALLLQLQVAIDVDDTKVCFVADRGFRSAQTAEERQLFLPHMTNCTTENPSLLKDEGSSLKGHLHTNQP